MNSTKYLVFPSSCTFDKLEMVGGEQLVPVYLGAVDLPLQPLLVVGLELLGELDLLAQHAVDAVVHGLVLARLGATVLPVAGGALATVVPDADIQ